MIKANELRIGNWVSGSFPNMIVQQVNKYNVECYMPESESDDFSYDLDELEPIPLTPEILEKSGFVKDEQYFTIHKSDFCVKSMDTSDKNFMLVIGISRVGVFIKYVHQLQNLYFALTGSELEINLTTVDTPAQLQ